MQQRVVIATALANDPALLVADEPTTALDVTIQAQMLALLRELRDRHRTTVILIAHDLGVVAQLCDRVGVLYAGQLVEVAPVERIFDAPEPSLHEGAARGASDAEPPAGGAAGRRRRSARSRRPAARLPVRAALSRAHATPCERVPAFTSRAAGHATACWHVEAERAA